MKKLLLLLLFAGLSVVGKAQAIYFTLDSIWSPPYICQANAFYVEVFGMRTGGNIHDGPQNEFLSNDTVYVRFHFTSGGGQAMPMPLHRTILVPAPPIGNYKVMVQGYHDGQLHKTISTTLSVCGGITGTKEPAPQVPELLIYPNPAQTKIEITGLPGTPTSVQVSVLDVAGKTLRRETLPPARTRTLAVETLPAGIYFLKLQADQGISIKKFVKQ